MLHAEEDAAQQHRLRAVPVLDRDLGERPERAADAGVVEHDVEAAELGERARDERLDVGLGRDVRALEDALRARRARLFGRRFAAGRVQVGQNHMRAFAREQDRARHAHAARRPGDHGDLALQLAHRRRSLLFQ